MFDAILLGALKDLPQQMNDAVPVVWAFAKANPLLTALVACGLLFGGGSPGRRES